MYKLLMSNCLRNSRTKKHRNRLIFDKVIGKIKGGGRFCGHTVLKRSRNRDVTRDLGHDSFG